MARWPDLALHSWPTPQPRARTAPGLTAIALAYDLGGRRTSLSDETGTTTFGYDGLDRPTSAAHSVPGTVTHGYDLAGRRTSLSTSTGAPTATATYEDAGRPLDVLRNSVTHAQASYDAPGRALTRTDALGKVWTSGYSSAGWLTSSTDPTNRAVSVGYDGLGRQVSSTDALSHQRRTVSTRWGDRPRSSPTTRTGWSMAAPGPTGT